MYVCVNSGKVKQMDFNFISHGFIFDQCYVQSQNIKALYRLHLRGKTHISFNSTYTVFYHL